MNIDDNLYQMFEGVYLPKIHSFRDQCNEINDVIFFDNDTDSNEGE